MAFQHSKNFFDVAKSSFPSLRFLPLFQLLRDAFETEKWKTTQQHLINFMFFALAKIVLTDDMMNKHADRDKYSLYSPHSNIKEKNTHS